MPGGRTLGNSRGGPTGGWGDVRGHNGVIIAAPSAHQQQADGGRYEWLRTGPVPVLPDSIAELLPDATDTVNVATDREVADFLAEHTTGDRLDELVGALLRGWRKAVDSGESCHGATVRTVVGAMKEVRAGQYPAEDAAAWLRQEFVAVMTAPRPTHGGTRPRVLPKSAATAEFDGILAWSVGQAKGADLTAVLARVNEKMPTLGELDVPARVEPARERHGGQLRFAERLAARHGDRLLNVHGIGWHVRDGARWRARPAALPSTRRRTPRHLGAGRPPRSRQATNRQALHAVEGDLTRRQLMLFREQHPPCPAPAAVPRP